MRLDRRVLKKLEGEMSVEVKEWYEDNLGAIVIELFANGDKEEVLKARYTEEDYLAYACENIANQLGFNDEHTLTLIDILNQSVGKKINIYTAHVDGYQRVKILRKGE